MAGTSEDSEKLAGWDDLLSEVRYIERQWKEMSGGMTPRKAAIYLGSVFGALVLLVGVIAWARSFSRPPRGRKFASASR